MLWRSYLPTFISLIVRSEVYDDGCKKNEGDQQSIRPCGWVGIAVAMSHTRRARPEPDIPRQLLISDELKNSFETIN